MNSETIMLLGLVAIGGFLAYRYASTSGAAAAPRTGSGLDFGFNFSKFGN